MFMIRTMFAGVALLLFISACKKNDTPLTPSNNPNSGDFTYEISGLRDTSLERIDEVKFVIFIEKKTGKGEKVVLSAEGMPDGMKISFTPSNEDTASFYTTLLLETERVKEGDYQINIKGASATSGIKNNIISVKVLPYSNHSVGLKGTFTETGSCSQTGSVTNNVTITPDQTVQDRVHIKGIFSGVSTNEIYADINASNNTLNIPKQNVNSVDYEGDGTYDDDKVIINYTITGITINESCTSTLTRK